MQESRENKGSKKIFFIISLIILVVSFVGGLYIGATTLYGLNPPLNLNEFVSSFGAENKEVDFKLFQRVWNTVKDKYYNQPIDENKLLYGALTGLVASLGDPYSIFLDPELTKQFEEEITGSFEGIGAEIGIKNDQLVIIAPLPNSPAEKSGLRPMDKVLKIDEQETGNISLEKAASLIRGKKGTKVTLLIQHEGEEEIEEKVIKRDKIKIQSITWEVKKGGGEQQKLLGYLRVLNFTEDIQKSFEKASNFFKLNDVEGIIMDLRNNSGGYLESAVDLASEFIKEGIVLTEKLSNDKKSEFKSNGSALFTPYPVVILINGGSASASEIVAGALKDHGIAKLVGEKSFGKGSVQEYEQLPDGSSLKITSAEWFTPNGQNINNQGIDPDIFVELTEEDYNNNRDPQLDKAIEVLIQEISK